MSMRELQEALGIWVRLEMRPDQPVIKVTESPQMAVVEIFDFPVAPPDSVRADVHFVLVAPTEGFPEQEVLIRTVRGACGQGEYTTLSCEDLSGGPSYITLGSWLGSQDLALALIGAVELAGIAKAITPGMLGVKHGERADRMAGMGLVMLGPSPVWGEG